MFENLPLDMEFNRPTEEKSVISKLRMCADLILVPTSPNTRIESYILYVFHKSYSSFVLQKRRSMQCCVRKIKSESPTINSPSKQYLGEYFQSTLNPFTWLRTEPCCTRIKCQSIRREYKSQTLTAWFAPCTAHGDRSPCSGSGRHASRLRVRSTRRRGRRLRDCRWPWS